MSVQLISAEQALTGLSEFSSVIDARSESEYAEDHLPGAANWPSLRDAERHQVGTQYKQVNAFEAKKRGAAIAARNIAAHIEAHVLEQPRDWAPLAYCWRGGKRSGAMAHVLREHPQSNVLLLAGNGHLRKDAGVYQWLSPQERQRTQVHAYLEAPDAQDAARFDQIHPIAAVTREDPCAAFRAAIGDAVRP